MKLKARWPSVMLEPGTMSSDILTDAIEKVGCREVARRVKMSPTSISQFTAAKLALPMDRVLHICDAVNADKELVWTSTLYDRIEACERMYGFVFRPTDEAKEERKVDDAAKFVGGG